MISNADSVPNGTCLEADVCVIGAGPAGIALTLDLSERGFSVLLLESGFMKEDSTTQRLYEGEVADEKLHSPPDKYRQRRFGGSSAIWGGRCMPFDPLDFETRSHVPHSGWPICYEDLLPYYPRANELSEAGRFSYSAEDALGADALPLIRGFDSHRILTNGLERFSCPTHFGSRYAKQLRLAPHVKVLLGANCTGIRLQPQGHAVRTVEVATIAGNRFSATCQFTVMAVGGLETARLLLASRDVALEGIGNFHDVVGRYYMCHIAGNVGQLTIQGPTKNVRHGYELAPEGIYCRRRLAVSPAEQRRLGLANAVARLHFPRITDPVHRNGVLSGLFLARRLISYEYGKRLNDGNNATTTTDYARHLLNVATDPIDTTAFLMHWLSHRSLADRKFPSVILRNRTNRFSLEMHGEQTPQARSRVMLSNKVDALGMPQLHVDWQYSPADIDSIRGTLEVLSQEFAASGVAQFEYDAETLEEDLTRFGAYGGHHIGTARMGTDERTSVVNAQCQVHSVHNLFIAGSAVFPTSSQANPTLTLIALSLRLAHILAQKLSRPHLATANKEEFA
ncbi:Glucose-methanol-choline (GMC) oxidoreductase:NAD binding site [Polaromonas sp. CG9_12]|nr:Glucose-methanol-choline (GMC) oxidoreductase:NAD binding site [Polaromonas sp. CG9_12]